MRKFLTFSVITLSMLLLSSVFVYSQQISPITLPVNQAKIVNFKALSDYQLSHPVKHKKRFVEQGEDREKGRTFKPRMVPAGAPVFNMPGAPRGSNTGNSPAPLISFDGTISNGSLFPPDINGAVGSTYIVESTNQEYDIYTKAGVLVNSLDIGNFFASQNIYYPYDPHVEYDAAHKRYILISDGFQNVGGSEGPSEIFVAVSETADPTGNWYTYSFNGYVVSTGDFLDYPLLGYNNNWVVVTGNDYTSAGPTQVNVWVLNRADLYKGTLGNVQEFSLTNYISITPTQTYDTTISEDYLVQDDNGNQGPNGYVQIGSVSGTLNNPTVSAGNTLGVPAPWSDNSSSGATQLGTTQTIESGLDTKIENAVYRNGSLWFTHTIYLPASNPTYSAVDWWQVNPTAFTVTQFGRIADPNGVIDYYYPSINVDANNNVVIGYTTSSPNIYASSEYSYRASTDALNTMETGYLYKQGQAIYDLIGGGRNRWGDFSFTSIDPSDNSFWTFQEFAASPANTWGTVIANIKGTPCSGTPTAGTISSSIDTPCNGEGVVLNLNGYSTNGTGIGILWQQSATGINGWKTPAKGTGDSTSAFSTFPSTGISFYRAFVRCNTSGLADTSAPIEVITPGIISTSLSPDTFCTPRNIDISADAVGSPVNWYSSNTSTQIIGSGNTLNATITKDTIFYVNTGKTVNHTLGIANDNGTGGYYNYTFDNGLLFDAINNFTLDSLYVYANSTGDVTVNLINNSTGATVAKASITITAAEVGVKTVIHTNFSCTGGITYNITAGGTSVSDLYRDAGDAVYPYTVPDVVSITGADNGAAGYYYFFYDWHISSGCVTNRVPVYIDARSCSGINSATSAKPSMEVYPNPTRGDFDIVLNNLPEQQYNISLFNILGQKSMEQQVDIGSPGFTLPMDASALPPGIYFIRVVAGDLELTQRIIKQ